MKYIAEVCKEYEYCNFHCPFYDRPQDKCCVADDTPDKWDLERIADICLTLVEEEKK